MLGFGCCAAVLGAAASGSAPVSVSVHGQVARAGGSAEIEISERTPVRSGEGVRVRLRATRDAYVYVLLYASTRRARLLHPPAGAAEEAWLGAGEERLVPPGGYLRLDDNPGVETVFVVSSDTPLREVQALLDGMEAGGADLDAVARAARASGAHVLQREIRHVAARASGSEPAPASRGWRFASETTDARARPARTSPPAGSPAPASAKPDSGKAQSAARPRIREFQGFRFVDPGVTRSESESGTAEVPTGADLPHPEANWVFSRSYPAAEGGAGGGPAAATPAAAPAEADNASSGPASEGGFSEALRRWGDAADEALVRDSATDEDEGAGPGASTQVAAAAPAAGDLGTAGGGVSDAQASGAGEKDGGAEPPRRVASAVVTVFSEHGSGSGAVIDPAGRVLTTWDAVGGAQSAHVLFPLGAGGLRRTRVLASDPNAGLALLALERAPQGLSAARLAPGPLAPGDPVQVLGRVGIEPWGYASGRVTQVAHGPRARIRAVFEAQGIGRGAALLNRAQELVGLIAAEEEGEAPEAVSGPAIRAFLDAARAE